MAFLCITEHSNSWVCEIDLARPELDLGLTGHIRDKSTGLTYMHARYYDPVVGRFLSVDPVTFMTTNDPALMNRYANCYGDPIGCQDPDGELGIFGAVAGAAIGGILSAYDQHRSGQKISYKRIAKDALVGAAFGATGGAAGVLGKAAVQGSMKVGLGKTAQVASFGKAERAILGAHGTVLVALNGAAISGKDRSEGTSDVSYVDGLAKSLTSALIPGGDEIYERREDIAVSVVGALLEAQGVDSAVESQRFVEDTGSTRTEEYTGNCAYANGGSCE